MKKPKLTDVLTPIYFNLSPVLLGFDIGYYSNPIDIESTSKNLDFSVSTYQTRFENIYFNCQLIDYTTKQSYDVGYFYIKDNNGFIAENHLKALYLIITEGTHITEKIFNNMEV